MFKLLLLGIVLTFPSSFAFAEWTYVPEGKQVTVAKAVNSLISGENPTSFTFTQGKMFLEFGNGNTATYARASSVATFEKAINAKLPAKPIVSGRLKYLQGWNKLYLAQGNQLTVIYNIFDDFRSSFNDAKNAGPIKDEEDARSKIIHIYQETYQLLSLVEQDVTYYAYTSGYSGGAHGYAGGSMVHKNFGFQEDSLLNLVDNQDLLDQLKQNPVLRKIGSAELDTITQLTDFDEAAPGITEMIGNGTRWSTMPGEQWKKYSIWDYDPTTQKAVIRLGLEYISEAQRGAFSQLEVTVKVKSELAKMLEAVKLGKTGGQLMKDVPLANQPPMNGRE